ncbi:MAG: hypothetical protein DCF20_01965 [Pseudanabaena sp.]|nr:MAG: hypothetical protein DCF20_01965 [Pseudanabaena sp.]
MIKTENFAQVEVTSTHQLREWLMANHRQKESVWLVTYKKHASDRYVSIQEVLDELLCFGWIDGIRRKLDDNRTMQLIAPRQAQHWAKSYKDRANKLQKDGRMYPAGLRAIEESKRKGLWDFMDDVDALIVPDDLAAALKAYPEATDYFDAFADSSKRFTLRWIKLAKTSATRAKRIEQAATLAAKNMKIPGI